MSGLPRGAIACALLSSWWLPVSVGVKCDTYCAGKLFRIKLSKVQNSYLCLSAQCCLCLAVLLSALGWEADLC